MDYRDFQRSLQRGDFDTRRIIATGAVVLLVIVGGYLLLNSYYIVQENENAVVLRFGEYHATVPPGLHFCIPVVDEVLTVNVTQERRIRLPFGRGPERARSEPEEQTLMLTGDLNAASVEWTLQWRISDPKKRILAFYDPEDEAIEDAIILASRTVMNRLVGDYSIDEVLTEKRSEIRLAAREATQELLDRYDSGVIVTDLQVQRVRPPAKVRPSFDAVNAAIQQSDKLENEANEERNKLIPQARAEADKKIREAEGYAARRLAEVNGEIEALRARYAAYSKAPDVTRRRLYLDAMQDVLKKVENKVIIDSDLQQVLPLLDLEKETGE